MITDPDKQRLFIAGGTLSYDAPSYVVRPADDALYYEVLAGRLCYVLTPRQMGKSSLMIRTEHRLQAAGCQTAVVDLSRIGTSVSDEQWYLSILEQLRAQLHVKIEPQTWWGENHHLGIVDKFLTFFHQIILEECESKVVIFIDEIDTTLSLGFSDDFFATVRAIYNARDWDSAYERVTFVLLGTATPNDLIKDPKSTPFNVGKRISLEEFNNDETNVLKQHLHLLYKEEGRRIYNRIHYWTGGHPYLTQKLCLGCVEINTPPLSDDEIDQLVDRLFLSQLAQRETNLQFIRDNISNHPQKETLLKLYQKVYKGTPVPVDEKSIVQNQLRMFGLLKASEDTLIIRNRIYETGFDLQWVKENLPVNWARRTAIAATFFLLLLLFFFGAIYLRQEQQTESIIAQQALAGFDDNVNRLENLSTLFSISGFAEEARNHFLALTSVEKADMFSQIEEVAPNDLMLSIQGIYIILTDTQSNNNVLLAMQTALDQFGDQRSQVLSSEISRILGGRQASANGDYETAVAEYSTALSLNGQNPISYYERASALIALEEYESALVDLESLLALTLDQDVHNLWQSLTEESILNDPILHAILWQKRNNYQEIAAIVATPTSTPRPTATLVPTPTATPRSFITTTVATLAGHTGPIKSAFFSNDGSKVISFSHDNTAKIWDTQSGELIATLEDHFEDSYYAEFSPDGTRLITADYNINFGRLWDVESGELIIVLERGPQGWQFPAVFNEDSSRLVTFHEDNGLRVREGKTGEVIYSHNNVDSWGFSTNFMVGGNLIFFSTRSSEFTTVIQGNTGTTVGTISGTGIKLLSSDGHLISTTTINEDNTEFSVEVWDVESLRLIQSFNDKNPSGSGTFIFNRFTPDNTRLVTTIIGTGEEHLTYVWDLETGQQIMTFTTDSPSHALFLNRQDGDVILLSGGGQTIVINAQTGEQMNVLQGNVSTGPQTNGYILSTSLFVTVSYVNSNYRSYLWDKNTFEQLFEIEGFVRHLPQKPYFLSVANFLDTDTTTSQFVDIQSGKPFYTFPEGLQISFNEESDIFLSYSSLHNDVYLWRIVEN